jgi:hypothetical protein
LETRVHFGKIRKPIYRIHRYDNDRKTCGPANHFSYANISNTMPKSKRLSANMEDYLETIYHIVSEKKAARAKDIAVRMAVNSASVTGALRLLAEKGHINYAPYDVITLTPSGETLARDIVRRHEILKDFLPRCWMWMNRRRKTPPVRWSMPFHRSSSTDWFASWNLSRYAPGAGKSGSGDSASSARRTMPCPAVRMPSPNVWMI